MKLSDCKCEKWQAYMPQIVGAQMLSWNHGSEYKGEPFLYCPWCGARREEIVEKAVEVSSSSLQQLKNDKVSWLLLEYDKTHEKSGLVVSGAFSADFVEWAIDRAANSGAPTEQSTTTKLDTGIEK